MKLKKIIDEVGPLLAGFQLAASVVGFFGIGAVAKWIINHWLPFTRWIWGYLVDLLKEYCAIIPWPDLSLADKDALTTLSFFTPMAISSFLVKKDKNIELDKNDTKELRLRIYATFLGILFMLIFGGSVIQDTITLFTTEPPGSTNIMTESKLNTTFFANIGLVFVMSGTIFIISLYICMLLQKRKPMDTSGTDEEIEQIKTRKQFMDYLLKRASYMAALIGNVASTIIFSTVSGGILLATKQLGPIRTISPVLVLLSLLVTIINNPSRLMRTAGVVFALVIASYGWDFAIWIVKAVENAPTS